MSLMRTLYHPSDTPLDPELGSDASSSSSEEEDEDPMAAYIRAERKKSKSSGKDKDKKKKKSKHDGETKEERKARKAAKKDKKEKKPRGDERALKGRDSEARGREEDVKPRVKREQESADYDRRRDRYSPEHGNQPRDRPSRHRPASRSPSPPTPPRRSRRSPSRSRSPHTSRMVKREEGNNSPARVVVKQETEVDDVKPFRNGAPDPNARTTGRRYSRSRSPGAFKQVKREPSPDRGSSGYRRREEHAYDRAREPTSSGRDTRYPPAPTGRREYDSGATGADRYDRRRSPLPPPVSSSYNSGSRADRDSDWRRSAAVEGGAEKSTSHDDGDRYGARNSGRGAHEEADYASWRGKRDADRVMRTVGRDERRGDDRSRR